MSLLQTTNTFTNLQSIFDNSSILQIFYKKYSALKPPWQDNKRTNNI